MASINPIYNINYTQSQAFKAKVENKNEPPATNPITTPNLAFKGTEALRAYNYNLVNKSEKSKRDSEYLKEIENEALKRMDNSGNQDGKVTVKEALKDLNIAGLLSGQNETDTTKIKAAAANIHEVLAKYAGQDGEFTAEEWANFLNSQEWDAVLDAWHSSEKDAKSEMNWIDNAHGIPDKAVTKGEVKVGILNNLSARGFDIDTTEIEAVIDKYAGEDGTFTQEEYMALRKDPIYKDILNKYDVNPWFK